MEEPTDFALTTKVCSKFKTFKSTSLRFVTCKPNSTLSISIYNEYYIAILIKKNQTLREMATKAILKNNL